MIKIAHEAPVSLFQDVQKLTDYDYALVHLFENNEDYFNLFKNSLENGREVILDNSIFELGTAFNTDKFIEYIDKLLPTWYVIPDSLENADKTIENVVNWKYKNKRTKSIGVVQGKNLRELANCYKAIEPYVDMIAISFDYSLFLERELGDHFSKSLSKRTIQLMKYAQGRIDYLNILDKSNYINKNKPHHLLGCALPFEGKMYKGYKWIYSMDTSNPVMAYLKNLEYHEDYGLLEKPSEKMCDLINIRRPDYIDLLEHNINCFRNFWK